MGEEQNRVVHVVDEFVWLFEKRAVTGDGEFDDVFAGASSILNHSRKSSARPRASCAPGQSRRA